MSEDIHSLRTIRKVAEEQGWRIERTGGDHLRWVPPDPQHSPVISGTTSSDWRAARNTLARLRRRGLRFDRGEEKAMEAAMKEPEPGTAEHTAGVAVVVGGTTHNPAEEQFWCADCGYGHPKKDMALTPQGKPTRFCGKHLRERLSRGRREQIARDRGRQKEEVMHDERTALPSTGEPETGVKELVRAEVEILLSALSDLEARMDKRLGAVEKGLENGHAAPDPAPGTPDLAGTLVRFAQQVMWLGSFDDADLSPDQKAGLVAKAAKKLAARLS